MYIYVLYLELQFNIQLCIYVANYAIVLNYVLDDEIFATIILKSKRDNIDDINLYEPVGSKTLFKDLQVSFQNYRGLNIYACMYTLKMAESFKWKQVNLIDKTSKVAMLFITFIIIIPIPLSMTSNRGGMYLYMYMYVYQQIEIHG